MGAGEARAGTVMREDSGRRPGWNVVALLYDATRPLGASLTKTRVGDYSLLRHTSYSPLSSSCPTPTTRCLQKTNITGCPETYEKKDAARGYESQNDRVSFHMTTAGVEPAIS